MKKINFRVIENMRMKTGADNQNFENLPECNGIERLSIHWDLSMRKKMTEPLFGIVKSLFQNMAENGYFAHSYPQEEKSQVFLRMIPWNPLHVSGREIGIDFSNK